MSQTSLSSSKSKPNSPDGLGHDHGHGGRPHQDPSPPRRRATHDPSVLHTYITTSQIKSDYCKTRRTSIEFLPQRRPSLDEREYYDTESAASGGAMDISSLVSMASNNINIGYDDQNDQYLAISNLFQVANHPGKNKADNRGGVGIGDSNNGSKHWQSAASVAMTSNTAETVPRDNTSRSHRHHRHPHGLVKTRSLDSDLNEDLFFEKSGFLSPALLSADDERSGNYISGSVDGGSEQQSVDTSRSDGSSMLWDHLESQQRRHHHHLSSSSSITSTALTDRRTRRRLQKSTLHVVRRFIKVTVGILVMAALLVYVAFNVDVESMMDSATVGNNNLFGKLFGMNDLVEEKEENHTYPRIRKLHQEHVNTKKAIAVPRAGQVVMSQQERSSKERAQADLRTNIEQPDRAPW
mmetsp:Transcript_14775/g.31816  ORF Transcript_14775/g.31816 Transcript_14775/m.31816 type:complete len:409 (+) Transcript_14775:204-1430(+)